MAKRVTVELIDDLTGQPGATTVTFGLDGISYEIDLVDEVPLRNAFGPWVSAARRVGGTRRVHQRHDLHLIRRWARDNGHPVPARGRLPAATIAAYDQHHQRAS